MAVQQFEDSGQRQYDGQLRSHVHALQDECRGYVGQEEEKLGKELQQALNQESSTCRDQLHQTLRHHVCQEEYADEVSARETNQLRLKVTEQERAFSQQEEYVHKQHTLFPKFDGALKDKDWAVQTLKQELANHKEQALVELEQAHQDMERVANTNQDPPAAAQRVPSMGLARRGTHSEGPPPRPVSQPVVQQVSGGGLVPQRPGRGGRPGGGGHGSGDGKHLFPP